MVLRALPQYNVARGIKAQDAGSLVFIDQVSLSDWPDHHLGVDPVSEAQGCPG